MSFKIPCQPLARKKILDHENTFDAWVLKNMQNKIKTHVKCQLENFIENHHVDESDLLDTKK
jgi:hypothetical protein